MVRSQEDVEKAFAEVQLGEYPCSVQFHQDVLDRWDRVSLRDDVLVEWLEVHGEADAAFRLWDRHQPVDPLRTIHGFPNPLVRHLVNLFLHRLASCKWNPPQSCHRRCSSFPQLDPVEVVREGPDGGSEQFGVGVPGVDLHPFHLPTPALDDCLQGCQEIPPHHRRAVVGDDEELGLHFSSLEAHLRLEGAPEAFNWPLVEISQLRRGTEGHGGSQLLEVRLSQRRWGRAGVRFHGDPLPGVPVPHVHLDPASWSGVEGVNRPHRGWLRSVGEEYCSSRLWLGGGSSSSSAPSLGSASSASCCSWLGSADLRNVSRLAAGVARQVLRPAVDPHVICPPAALTRSGGALRRCSSCPTLPSARCSSPIDSLDCLVGGVREFSAEGFVRGQNFPNPVQVDLRQQVQPLPGLVGTAPRCQLSCQHSVRLSVGELAMHRQGPQVCHPLLQCLPLALVSPVEVCYGPDRRTRRFEDSSECVDEVLVVEGVDLVHRRAVRCQPRPFRAQHEEEVAGFLLRRVEGLRRSSRIRHCPEVLELQDPAPPWNGRLSREVEELGDGGHSDGRRGLGSLGSSWRVHHGHRQWLGRIQSGRRHCCVLVQPHTRTLLRHNEGRGKYHWNGMRRIFLFCYVHLLFYVRIPDTTPTSLKLKTFDVNVGNPTCLQIFLEVQ